MKTLVLLIFFFSFTFNIQAQTWVYHPFPEDTARWITDDYSNICSGYCASHLYEMNGDTIINSQSYNKIYIRSGSFYTTIFSTCRYAGAIRQDSINKKVYFIDSTMTTDTLLYDFNLAIGDSIHYWYNRGGTPFPLVVSGFDSVFINGSYRKRFHFQNNYKNDPYMMLIEGVGWTGDLLEGLYHSGDGWIILACFNGEQMASIVVQNECSLLACNFSVGIDKENEKEYFTLSPNPFHTTATLEIKNKELKNAELRIYNVMGRLVQQHSIVNRNAEIINREGLPDGIYFYQLVSDNGQVTNGKFVIE